MEYKHNVNLQALFLLNILHGMHFENYDSELNNKINDLYDYLTNLLYKDIQGIPNDILNFEYTETIFFDK